MIGDCAGRLSNQDHLSAQISASGRHVYVHQQFLVGLVVDQQTMLDIWVAAS